MLNSRNQKRKAYSIEMSTNVPAEQAKKRRAENKIEIDLGFKLNVIKNGYGRLGPQVHTHTTT